MSYQNVFFGDPKNPSFYSREGDELEGQNKQRIYQQHLQDVIRYHKTIYEYRLSHNSLQARISWR